MTAKTGTRLLIVFGIIFTSILYFGNFTTKEITDALPVPQVQEGIGFDMYETLMLAKVEEAEKERLRAWRSELKETTDPATTAKLAHELAHEWERLGNPYLENYYHFIAAEAENNVEELAAAGDRFNALFRQTQDTLIKNNLLTFALRSYEAALERAPDDLSLKVKTGAAYVEGSSEPMKGISLLREVIDADPKNADALIMLGRFSILSGQYDKAKQYLDRVLVLQPNNAEAIYFMAITQEGLGDYEKAVELLEICKKLVSNPDFDAEVSGYIERLKNNIK